MNFGTLLCCCGTHEKTHGLSQKIQAMYFKIQGTYFKISALYFKIHGLYFSQQAMCFFRRPMKNFLHHKKTRIFSDTKNAQQLPRSAYSHHPQNITATEVPTIHTIYIPPEKTFCKAAKISRHQHFSYRKICSYLRRFKFFLASSSILFSSAQSFMFRKHTNGFPALST